MEYVWEVLQLALNYIFAAEEEAIEAKLRDCTELHKVTYPEMTNIKNHNFIGKAISSFCSLAF